MKLSNRELSKKELRKQSKKELEKKGEKKPSGHGSLTKSGKVRTNTPPIPKTNLRKKPIPRVTNRRRYLKMLYENDKKEGAGRKYE